LLHDAENKIIKQAYNIKSCPTYFFINKEGFLVQSPAKYPSQGIEFLFKELFKEKVKKKNK
jgi:hypothetical protein